MAQFPIGYAGGPMGPQMQPMFWGQMIAMGQQQGLDPMESVSMSQNAQYSMSPQEQRQMLEMYQMIWMLQQQMQQQMMQGDWYGAQATQQQLQGLYQQMDPGMNRVHGPDIHPQWPHGGGPWGSGPEMGGGPGPGAIHADPGQFHGGTPMGRNLASMAFQHATDGTGDGHHCYRNVKQDLARVGVHVTGGSAYQAADQLARSNRFQEVQGLSRQDLRQLPPGAVVVWNRGNGHEHGHISIAMGDGREASDVMRRQITNYGTSYRVFLPNEDGSVARHA